MKRRDFLGVAAGAAALRAASAASETGRPATRTVTLGATGLTTSLVGLGTGMRGWNRQSNHTRMGRPAFSRLIHHALDQGVRLFDAADLYGTHAYLRDILREVDRGRLTIQTKIWFADRGLPEPVTDARAAVERFLTELGTDYLDIVLLHCATAGNWPDQLKRMVDGLEQARADGLLRAHGVSCHSRAALDASAAGDWAQIQLARLNHARRHMDGTPEEIAALLRAMRAAGKGVIGMKIFGEGSLRTPADREASLRFVLGSGALDAMIIGFEQPEQIDETLGMIDRILAE